MSGFYFNMGKTQHDVLEGHWRSQNVNAQCENVNMPNVKISNVKRETLYVKCHNMKIRQM